MGTQGDHRRREHDAGKNCKAGAQRFEHAGQDNDAASDHRNGERGSRDQHR